MRYQAFVAGFSKPRYELAMPLIAITAQDIDTAGIEVNVDLPQNWLDLELADADAKSSKPGSLHARLSRSGNHVVVRGEVKANVSVPCARCLEPAQVELAGELSLLLKPLAHAHEPRDRGAAEKKPARPAASEAAGDAAKWAEAAAKMMPDWAAAPKKAPKTSKPDEKKGKAGSKAAHGGRKEKESKAPDEYEFTAEEADTDTYDGDTVVLDAFVREALLLEMPNFPLCSDTCPGIRPAAAAPEAPAGVNPKNDVLDPRLAPLAALSASLSNKPRSNGQNAPPDEQDAQAQTAKKVLPEMARNTAKKKR